MSYRIYVPLDSSAVSRGADKVVKHLEQSAVSCGEEITIVRNGSHGLFWLEPMVEVESAQGRIAFGPVFEDDVDSLLALRFFAPDEEGSVATEHPLCLGLTKEIDWLKRQQRLTFERVGYVDPLDVEDYRSKGGFIGLNKALNMPQQMILDEVKASGLRGRGGAAFPTGIKWQTVADQPPGQKYVICNADEGDSGTFADRMLMEGDPFTLIEGMIICALAVGATQGYVYTRSEYPNACKIFTQAIENAYKAGYLGDNICGSRKSFHLELRMGAGAYICGEETSLMESLEGKRGLVRNKPPLPAIEGLFGKPTVINNVISLASVPIILAKGADYYRDFGQGRSLGTLPIQLAGNIQRPGLFELAFGVTVRELLYDFGGGSRTGRPLKAVQIGGPLAAYLPEQEWDTDLDYEHLASRGAMLGHGGMVAFDDQTDMSQMARFAMEFCEIESCGKCTPCRIGSVRGVEVIDRLTASEGEAKEANHALLVDLCDTMELGSLCAMGGMTPAPVKSALKYFAADFGLNDGSVDSDK
ncbi:formate dehydrogenase beta subunit [Enterovibrio paralichthyis]|uniref:formate dehydrogenase beta subunit n=1 Tax=Enterovibrio paralichthyis TaxID=2853805 RepID=UPI001C4856A8|nr:NADH-quinone oxidoreductase subunit NuoF [Enterovibrio paralichthyis]MBV7300485.1 NADH-quinone oxidoreductase subunit NuoF [Enterovibrio paralichthyis]